MDGSNVEEIGSTPFFRPESVAAARDRLGAPVRPVGVASWILAAFMATLLIAMITFLCGARYARRETVTGVLQPAAGALRIASVRPGIVAAVNVREGQDVVQGQSLIILAFDPTMTGGQRLGDLLSNASDDQNAALTRQAVARHDLIGRQRDEIAAKRALVLDQQQRLVTDVALQRERVALADQTAQAARAIRAMSLPR